MISAVAMTATASVSVNTVVTTIVKGPAAVTATDLAILLNLSSAYHYVACDRGFLYVSDFPTQPRKNHRHLSELTQILGIDWREKMGEGNCPLVCNPALVLRLLGL